MQSGDLENREHSAEVSVRPTILCFAHLRWNFVYQRPQHLLTRAAQHADVFFIEEPVYAALSQPTFKSERQPDGVEVVVPYLPEGTAPANAAIMQKVLFDEWLVDRGIEEFIAWYYTPMALLFTDHLEPAVTIYDCMDQLSAFQNAPPELVALEQRLFARADVVFTGGRSLFEEKRGQHANVHLFASSVDRAHFAAGRVEQADPPDQAAISHPRIGFFGVLDERLDRELLREAATLKPEWNFVLIGPVVKIREEELPRAANIHYLGQKHYRELPTYLAHWDVAMLPFALNASTRFISPTKTPEYLAAGKPVVSTPVPDVVEPYGTLGLARIAVTPKEFCDAIAASLEMQSAEWLPAVDEFLNHTSWDATFEMMWQEVKHVSTTVREEAREERLYV